MKCVITMDGRGWEIDRPEVDESRGFHISSIAKVCPKCLRMWAILDIGGTYSIQGQFCQRCSFTYDLYGAVPGSLLDDYSSQTVDWDLIRYLPEELLKREFDLHVRTLGIDSHDYLTSNTTWHLPAGTDESQFAHIDTRTGEITPSGAFLPQGS